MTAKRKREYQLFAPIRGGPFSNGRYPSWEWIYRVFAYSIKQAYWLAGREEFAAGPNDTGVREIEFAWWHHHCLACQATRDGCAGHHILAPYLREDE